MIVISGQWVGYDRNNAVLGSGNVTFSPNQPSGAPNVNDWCGNPIYSGQQQLQSSETAAIQKVPRTTFLPTLYTGP